MNTFSHVPPGFRFHPTDEQLVDYYLRKKIASKRIDLDIIKDVDLYRIEPWDIQELCNMGNEEQNDWYFFSYKDKKYPTGTRTNRATKAGFWKATGRDKAIYSKNSLVGMRKTLVFYKGRAPNGQKSDWIMHEYRLEINDNGASQEEGWVVCRVFKKKMPTMRKVEGWYDDEQTAFMQDFESPSRNSHPYTSYHQYPCKQEADLSYNIPQYHHPFLQLPQLESPRIQSTNSTVSCIPFVPTHGLDNNNISALQTSTITQDQEQVYQSSQQNLSSYYSCTSDRAVDQVTDWRALDKFVASQLSHEEASKEPNYLSESVFHEADRMSLLVDESKEQENATSASSCPIDLWK